MPTSPSCGWNSFGPPPIDSLAPAEHIYVVVSRLGAVWCKGQGFLMVSLSCNLIFPSRDCLPLPYFNMSLGTTTSFLGTPIITSEKLNGKHHMSWFASFELWFLGQGFCDHLEEDGVKVPSD